MREANTLGTTVLDRPLLASALQSAGWGTRRPVYPTLSYTGHCCGCGRRIAGSTLMDCYAAHLVKTIGTRGG